MEAGSWTLDESNSNGRVKPHREIILSGTIGDINREKMTFPIYIENNNKKAEKSIGEGKETKRKNGASRGTPQSGLRLRYSRQGGGVTDTPCDAPMGIS